MPVKNILILIAFLVIPFAFFVKLGNVFLYDQSSPSGTFLKPRRLLGVDIKGNPPEETLKFVGCGFPKCGTSSMEVAMDRLGYKTYHVRFMWRYPGHMEMWLDALRDPEKNLQKVLDEVLKLGYNATSSGTLGILCLDIHRLYPDAQVVLSVRDNEEQWAESFKRFWNNVVTSLVPAGFPWTFFWDPLLPMVHEFCSQLGITYEVKFHDSVLPWVPKFSEEIVFPNDEELFQAYRDFYGKVKRTVPKEKLLVHNMKEGWDPLLEFFNFDGDKTELGSYPHENAGSIFLIIKFFFLRLKWWPFFVVFMMGYLYFMFKKIKEIVKYGL